MQMALKYACVKLEMHRQDKWNALKSLSGIRTSSHEIALERSSSLKERLKLHAKGKKSSQGCDLCGLHENKEKYSCFGVRR